MTAGITLKLERDGYRLELGPNGLRMSAIGRSYHQRDERAYETCIFIPLVDLPALGELVHEFQRAVIDAGLAA